jgi:three-Cys-motif partner protein
MVRKQKLKLDPVGYWSEIKLDIIREYAPAYSKILSAQDKPKLDHVYIDGFAGAGIHVSRTSGELIEGSPSIAIGTEPPFREYFFIDWDGAKADHLRALFGNRPDVHVETGDCNEVMLQKVLPRVRFQDYRRGLCLLDPYGLHLDWRVIEEAGRGRSIDLFLNFPIMDMNRNVFWRNTDGVAEDDIARMNSFWGDETWRQIAYRQEQSLFGTEDVKTDNETVAAAFRLRLQNVAKFAKVPEPMPMRNSTGAIIYYLFFASQKGVAQHIVQQIFDKYRDRGSV